MKPILEILKKSGPASSSDINRQLVLNFNLSRDAARKRLQRMFENGDIQRFIRLNSGGYLYYIPREHSKVLVTAVAKAHLKSSRPELWRIVKLIDDFKILSKYEISRLANLNPIKIVKKSKRRYRITSPELEKLLQDLKLLNYKVTNDFVTSTSLENTLIETIIEKAERKFEEEANLLYIAKEFFIENRLADELNLYRVPFHISLINKFDAFGHKILRKKSNIIVECHIRRIVRIEDLIGFHRRVFSTIFKGRRISPVPTYCYVLAYQFSEEALEYAFKKGIRAIIVEYRTNKHVFKILEGPEDKSSKRSSFRGRLADAQGRAFESAVEKAFIQRNFITTRRKLFYMNNGVVSEIERGKILTDVDVFVTDENRTHAFLVECKSSKTQIPRSELLRIVKNFGMIAKYLKQSEKIVSSIIIGNFNELDKVDAKKRSEMSLTFYTPTDFYKKYKTELEGEPRWLFK